VRAAERAVFRDGPGLRASTSGDSRTMKAGTVARPGFESSETTTQLQRFGLPMPRDWQLSPGWQPASVPAVGHSQMHRCWPVVSPMQVAPGRVVGQLPAPVPVQLCEQNPSGEPEMKFAQDRPCMQLSVADVPHAEPRVSEPMPSHSPKRSHWAPVLGQTSG
jgi:hypothetical protein